MKNIVVNNPAARSSGALTILKEFLEKTSSLKCNNRFIVFVSLEELKKYETDRLKIIVIPPQGFKNRILWDNFGLKKYLKENSIQPDIFISIQNTGVNLPKEVPQIVYYHQSLSLCKNNWNPLRKDERAFWMYENIYPFFINQYLDRIRKIIVQADWVKESFNKKFGYTLENIVVEKPKINLPDIDKVNVIPRDKFRIFYPATPLIYKNHKVVIEALGLLKKENPELVKNMECVFTFSKGEYENLDRLIEKYSLQDTIKLIGKISYEKALEYYKSSDLMVFPSYIETLGLPLLEAKHFGLSILSADLPYAREVVGEYDKVEFVEYQNVGEWNKNYLNILKGDKEIK